MIIRLSKSVLSGQEVEAVQAVLEKEFLGMGPEVMAFEKELASYLDLPTTAVSCVNTGTSALHLALQAAGIGAGDEVLVPSLTYVASFQAISATGAKPIACDVNLDDALLDLHSAKQYLSSKTKAIMPVHYAGHVGNLNAVYEFAQEHQLRVIEDAAHAFGSVYADKKIGAQGDIVCFSFDGIKNITSGEGGLVCSSDPQIISHIADARLLGVAGDSMQRYKKERSWDFEVYHQGWRYHMSDIMAAIGRVQLQRFEKEFKPRRQEIAIYYRSKFESMPHIRLLNSDVNSVVPHIFPIRILNNKRDTIQHALQAAGVGVGLHYKPNHRLNFYQSDNAFPNTERLYQELLTIPLHPDLSASDVEHIVDIIKNYN